MSNINNYCKYTTMLGSIIGSCFGFLCIYNGSTVTLGKDYVLSKYEKLSIPFIFMIFGGCLMPILPVIITYFYLFGTISINN